jgi:phosphatidylglycerophosphatase C
VAVFDLDGTLVRGDSLITLIWRLLAHDWWRAGATLLLAPALGPMLFLPHVRRLAITAIFWLATAGVSPAQFDQRVRAFAVGYCHAGNRIEAVLKQLARHAAAGHRVMVVTGCAEPLAAALCTALGVQVEIVAARLQLRPACAGLSSSCRMWDALPGATGERSFGAEKVRRLRGAGVSMPIDCAYTNSTEDVALLLAAKERFIVDPVPRTLRRLQTLIGPGYHVLRSGGAPESSRRR